MSSFYISAGLPANDTGESETGTNCFFITAGLPPDDKAGAGGVTVPIMYNHYQQMMRVC